MKVEKILGYEVHRKKVKNINLRIKPNMEIYISAPMNLHSDYIENFIRSKEKWIKQVDDKEFYKSTDEEKGIFLGIVNFRAENYEEAKKYLLQSYAYDKIGASENVLGMIYWEEGNQKEAQKWFLKSSDKGNSGAQANLGSLYYELNDEKESLKWLEKAYETARKDKDTEQMKEIKEMIKDVKDSQE